MYIKDSTFKKMNLIYISLTFILIIVLIYEIINTMVSFKYETEKEIINIHTNLASEYIEQTLTFMYVFLAYLLLNIIYLLIVGYVKLMKT